MGGAEQNGAAVSIASGVSKFHPVSLRATENGRQPCWPTRHGKDFQSSGIWISLTGYLTARRIAPFGRQQQRRAEWIIINPVGQAASASAPVRHQWIIEVLQAGGQPARRPEGYGVTAQPFNVAALIGVPGGEGFGSARPGCQPVLLLTRISGRSARKSPRGKVVDPRARGAFVKRVEAADSGCSSFGRQPDQPGGRMSRSGPNRGFRKARDQADHFCGSGRSWRFPEEPYPSTQATTGTGETGLSSRPDTTHRLPRLSVHA